MEKIKSVVAITPVWNEPLGMIQQFLAGIETVRNTLVSQGVGFRHFFLDDGALNLPDEYSILVRNKENLGLARTLVRGYKAVLDLKSKPDLVIRLDCQEHDPGKIPFVVDHLAHASSIQCLFLPVWYWVEGCDRPAIREITYLIADFCRGLSPIDRDRVLGIYNQKFPLGYQGYRVSSLERLLPRFEQGLEVFQSRFGTPATWGFDLLAILLSAQQLGSDAIDFVFGGWSSSWIENRGPDKIAAQKKKAEAMIDVAMTISQT